jgi:hypothetical protein
MADERDGWIRNIKAVEREYIAMRFAVDRSLRNVRQEPSILPRDLTVRQVERAAVLLEGTYIIRLFAEFETALRVYFRKARRRRPPSRTQDLLESAAAIRRMPPGPLGNAHTVREYRNVLVHERDADADPVTMAEARRRLCIYCSFLPRDW